MQELLFCYVISTRNRRGYDGSTVLVTMSIQEIRTSCWRCCAEHYWLYTAKAAACREMLCTLTNCTYLVDSTDALDILRQSLQKAYEQLLPCIPSENGLQLNSTCEQHSQRRSKKRHKQPSVSRCTMQSTRASSDIPLRSLQCYLL